MSTIELSLRPAVLEDLELTLDWANDPLTRKASFDSAPIDAVAHAAWFERSLGGERRLYIAEAAGCPVGLYRLDSPTAAASLADAEVSITVAPASRGRGIGRALLRDGSKLARELGIERLLARIRCDNGVSLHMFAAAGFVRVGADTINGARAYIYVGEVARGDITHE
jgi:L-amino acid N-acyltransferase YncA